MGLYIYCFVPTGYDPPSWLEGVKGGRVTGMESRGLGLWFSRLPAAPEPSLESVRRHHEVVMTAMDGGVTPLPVRFGEWFPTRERLQAWLRERGRGYGERLDQVTGTVEFGVRIVHPAKETGPRYRPGGASGDACLEALVRRRGEGTRVEERGRSLATALGRRLNGLVVLEQIVPPEPERGLVTVAHLVPWHRSGDYREAVDGFLRQPTDEAVELHLSGPWPPYSFAE